MDGRSGRGYPTLRRCGRSSHPWLDHHNDVGPKFPNSGPPFRDRVPSFILYAASPATIANHI